ncbi:MAG: hypothetical protein RR900_02565, partial [Ruthenibacterium sp.]
EDHLETENEKELAARAISAGESATGGVVRMGNDTEAFDAAVVKELFESGRLDNATAAHLVGNVRRRALQQTDRETYQA